MQVRIVSPGEVLESHLVDVELCGPVDIPRVWLEGGSNPPNLPKVSPKVANLRHVVMRNLHDVSAIWSHPTQTPPEIIAGLEWYDVYSDLHGWFVPEDPIRPSGLHGHSGYFQTDESFGVRTLRKGVMGRSFAGTVGKVYAESERVTDGIEYGKTANYLFEDCVFFGGSFLIGNQGAGNRDAINITVRRCVFINSALTVGYNGHSCADNTVEDCIIFGTLSVKPGTNITVRNNTVITEGPYRPPGHTSGPGAVSVNFGNAANYINPVFENNLLYTDGATSAFSGRTRAQSADRGGMVAGTEVVGGLDDFPGFTRRIDIPERDAAWLVVYNPSGAETIPLDGYYRVRDVRRWHSSYVSNELVMSGEPDAPMNWPPEYGPPPIAPNLFPEKGIFRLETVTPEEIVTELEQRLIAVEAELASIRQQIAGEQAAHVAELAARDAQIATLTADNAAKDAQIATLTAERDAALASASVFRGVLGQANSAVSTLASMLAGYPPVAA